MANKNNKLLSDKYYKALTQLGKKVSENDTLKHYREIWKDLGKEYKQRGEKRPTLNEASKEFDYEKTTRDSNMNTSPLAEDLDEAKAEEILQAFESDVIEIYHDTLAYIDRYSQQGWTHAEGKLANIAKQPHNMDAINTAYFNLINKINDIKESDIPKKIIAQAIQDNVELDYVISITLMPPSDIQLEFERTLEQLDAVLLQIEARAQELAEQAEREYLGE